MKTPAERPSRRHWTISPENQEKLARSRQEVEGLSLRPIACPRCGFTVGKVFSDASGHRLIKCPKCKLEAVINVAYFRRQSSFQKRHPDSYIARCARQQLYSSRVSGAD